MRGSNCIQCVNNENSEKRRTKLESFINRSSKLYDRNYDYSLVSFNNLHEYVTVICPLHGAWEVIAANHIVGKSGCPFCQQEKNIQNLRQINILSQEEFLEKCFRVHGDNYNYSKAVYTGTSGIVSIICNKHGEFEQVATHHLNGKGCKECAIELNAFNASSSGKDLLNKFRDIHGKKYKYELPEKVRYNDYINITCKKHGIYRQLVKVHLEQKGCPKMLFK